MNLTSNFSTSSLFRNLAAAFSAPGEKTIAGDGLRGEGSVGLIRDKFTLSPEGRTRNEGSTRPIRDEFTLSHQGQEAYAKHVSKLDKTSVTKSKNDGVVSSMPADIDSLDKTEQSVPATQTQVAENAQTSRIFSTASESVDNLVQFLGLDLASAAYEPPLAGALGASLNEDNEKLTARLNDLLQQAGLDGERNSLILSEDADGKIVVESIEVYGEVDSGKMKHLADLIDNDQELVEQIKDFRAKQDIWHGLFNGKDIASDDYAAARQQLVKSYLQREGGLSLDDVTIKTDPATGAKSLIQKDSNGNEVMDSRLSSLLSKIPGLEAELFNALESPQKHEGESARLFGINPGYSSNSFISSHLIEEVSRDFQFNFDPDKRIDFVPEGGEQLPEHLREQLELIRNQAISQGPWVTKEYTLGGESFSVRVPDSVKVENMAYMHVAAKFKMETKDNPLLSQLANHLIAEFSQELFSSIPKGMEDIKALYNGSFNVLYDMEGINVLYDRVSQALAEAREILELREKLGFETDEKAFQTYKYNPGAGNAYQTVTHVDYGLLKTIMASNSQWGVKNLVGGWTTYTKDASFTKNVASDADMWSLDWLRQAAAAASSVEGEQDVDSDPLDNAHSTGAHSTNAHPTGAYAKVDADGNKVPLASLLNMDYESASPKEQNLINWAKRVFAVHQWERANDFSFSSNPSTPEGKKAYNDMLLKAMQEGVQPLHGFRGSLNRVEGTDWMIADGAEALIGHEILSMFENTDSKFGTQAGQVNEYGFTVSLPGSYQGTNYHTISLTIATLQSETFRKVANDVEILWHTQGANPNKFVKPADIPTANIKAPILGLDGGQTYSPEINFTDALGLDGMSLGDRKLFLDMTQKILDEVMPGMDARQLKFSTGQRTAADVKNNTFSLTLDVAWLSIEQRNTIEEALNQDRQLFEMKHRADMSGNKGQGEFTISVLDAQGNALAKDQVRLIAGDKSVITSVDNIKDLDHSQMYDFVTKGVLPSR